MSQSTTITHKHGRRDALTKHINSWVEEKEERINIEIDEQIEYEQRKDVYPEPEGGPIILRIVTDIHILDLYRLDYY